MNVDLRPSTRRMIEESPVATEAWAFVEWLQAREVPHEPLDCDGPRPRSRHILRGLSSGAAGLEPHTIRSYRDALLLLRFTARERRRTVDRLDIADFSVERITRFLASLEHDRLTPQLHISE